MADVFISYSSADHDEALALAGRLRAAGYSVWIDESAIGAASKWTKEIVLGIEECNVFILLISKHSFASHNVIKELSLASEANKSIVPVDLEAVELTHDVKYQLAGIQRVPYSDSARIIEAVGRFLVPKTPVSKWSKLRSRIRLAPRLKKKFVRTVIVLACLIVFGEVFDLLTPSDPKHAVAATTTKKMVVVPFQSLSSNKDDEFFADGLTTELISTLSHQSGLDVIDRQTTMQLKGRKDDVKEIASDLGVRYVVDGTVRKQDKIVRITAELVDVQTGKVTNLENLDGNTDDLLELQTRLAMTIAFQLQGTIGEGSFLDSTTMRNATSKPEAYTALAEGLKHFTRVTSDEQLQRGFASMQAASKIDPTYIYPYFLSAGGYLARFSGFTHDPRDLQKADSFARVCLRTDPNFSEAYSMLVQMSLIRSEFDSAIYFAQRIITLQPKQSTGYSLLGSTYYKLGRFDRAAENLEQAVRLSITDLPDWSTLIDCYGALGDTAHRNQRIHDSKPLYDLFLQRYPTNTTVRLQYAVNLANFGDRAGTHAQIERVLSASKLEPTELYNIACCYALLGETNEALAMLRRSLSEGYDGGDDITKDPDFAKIKHLAEFKELAAKFAASKTAAKR